MVWLGGVLVCGCCGYFVLGLGSACGLHFLGLSQYSLPRLVLLV